MTINRATINAERRDRGLPEFDSGMLMKEPVFNLSAISLGMGAPREHKIYIAGPMRGLPNSNYDEFHYAAARLKGLGYEVENPADHFDGDQTREFSEYMQAALLNLMTCDSIALLPGWEDSEGAQIEATAAKALGMDFYVLTKEHGVYEITKTAPPISVTRTNGSETIDAEARRLVFRGARQEDYGHPRGEFDRIAKIWSGILGIEVTAELVAVCMIGLKLGRLSHSPQHHDSKVDVIGYALCLDRLQPGAD